MLFANNPSHDSPLLQHKYMRCYFDLILKQTCGLYQSKSHPYHSLNNTAVWLDWREAVLDHIRLSAVPWACLNNQAALHLNSAQM